ncbi:MAG: ADP-glyceromanno-heptose 6-epimerase [Betaproteobacteria bacterium]|nr:ADP-glyceromanno-heptose 6-epimerase [Betaproteobacteria bacterium]
MYYVVTGAAGFIGSNIVRALNERGEIDVIAVDNLERGDKFRNLANCEIADFLDKRDFLTKVQSGSFDGAIECIFHQGACSDTMEQDGRYMMENNYRYSVGVLDFCCDEEIPLIYASSAAVYGAGLQFLEDRKCETPLNVYGYSKFLFDQVVRRRLGEADAQIAGFRYFNVYGRNEWHKGRMASVAWHFFNQYRKDGCVRPFAGADGYGDGEQRRDFVAVEDIVDVNMFFLDHRGVSGIFNVGTGKAQSFNDVAVAIVNACRRTDGEPPIDLATMLRLGAVSYAPFPEALTGKYQSYTQADIGALRRAGYEGKMISVEQGVDRYVSKLISEPMFK